ncbi:hypothetical protein DMJ13_02035 [halophilic archaeon]|nr:hypothetical protein DMJ13_02035 [halophilic archaeon]
MANQQRPSDEVDEKQLELAREEGDAYHEALQYMATEVAHTGDTQEAGDFLVGIAQEEAEGMYRPTDDGLEWVEPDEENCHLEVAVADAADHRFVPELTVRATLESEDGEEVGPFEVPFVWHPGLHHYGKNVEVPGDGSYDVHVEVDAPAFMRHDETNGDRYAESVSVTFEGVDVETGQD